MSTIIARPEIAPVNIFDVGQFNRLGIRFPSYGGNVDNKIRRARFDAIVQHAATYRTPDSPRYLIIPYGA